MTTRADLLERGYFPFELPPPFHTSDYSSKVIANANNLPVSFSSFPTNPTSAKTMCHNLMRVGRLRRHIGIPNPILYYGLSGEIEQDWNYLLQFFNTSTLSKSKPTIGSKSGRAIIHANSIKDLLERRAELRSKSKYILRTDISRFYPSIYTHSIPWALHTKLTSKSRRNDFTLPGNRLDKWLRNCQDGQTIGIPIGPDTSFAISEIISTSIDNALVAKCQNLRGFRYIDDYEFGFKTLGAAEEMLALVEESLRYYELEVNVQKTEIYDLPQPLESEWVQTFRKFQFRSTKAGQYSDITCFFDCAFRLAQIYTRDSVLNYAVTVFRDFPCNPANWDLLQSLLLQTLMVEPSTIIKVFSVLLKFQSKGYQLDTTSLEEILNYLIVNKSFLGHSSEIAWSVWAIIVLGITIDGDAARALSLVQDSVIALLSLDALNRGLIPGGLNTATWESYMDSNELYGEQWLLSYEANIKGWLPLKDGFDHVAADRNFGFLKSMNVEFYNSTRVISSTPTFANISKGMAPLFSLP